MLSLIHILGVEYILLVEHLGIYHYILIKMGSQERILQMIDIGNKNYLPTATVNII